MRGPYRRPFPGHSGSFRHLATRIDKTYDVRYVKLDAWPGRLVPGMGPNQADDAGGGLGFQARAGSLVDCQHRVGTNTQPDSEALLTNPPARAAMARPTEIPAKLATAR